MNDEEFRRRLGDDLQSSRPARLTGRWCWLKSGSITCQVISMRPDFRRLKERLSKVDAERNTQATTSSICHWPDYFAPVVEKLGSSAG